MKSVLFLSSFVLKVAWIFLWNKKKKGETTLGNLTVEWNTGFLQCNFSCIYMYGIQIRTVFKETLKSFMLSNCAQPVSKKTRYF